MGAPPLKRGQTLFIIDQVPYQAAVKSAQASVNLAKTQVETARLTLAQKKNLHEQQIISDFDLEVAENALATQVASWQQAEAQLTNARNNLSYTRVKSPSDGVVGMIPFRTGSLASPSMVTPLTTVSATDEMFIYFSMTEKQLLELTRVDGNTAGIIEQMPPVELRLTDGSIYAHLGRIETVSGVIDPATGSVSVRALFPNPDRLLRSGGAGNILIPYQLTDQIVIPQGVTYEIQDKKFVYTLAADSTVRSRAIEIFPLNDGHEYVITSGVTAGETIVAEGVQTLREGTKVSPITAAKAAAAPTAAPSDSTANQGSAE